MSILTNEDSSMAANAIAHAVTMAQYSIQNAAELHAEPSAIYRPTLIVDGDRWCALYGVDLQNGVAGFGESPAAAMMDFNKQWHASRKARHDHTNRSAAAGFGLIQHAALERVDG